MAYRGLIPGRHPVKEMQRSRVMEIAPDIWEIEGYLSTSFFFKPPSSNCFILRDNDLVLLVDTGTYPFYRRPMLDILERFRRDGARRLVLMLTQGHFDHIGNNDLILEAGYDEVRFLLPEAEVSTFDVYHHWTGEYLELRDYYDPYRQLPLKFPTAIPHLVGRVSWDLAQKLIQQNIALLVKGMNTLGERAEILPMDSRVTRTFGEVEFQGWEVGRFFAVHDGTHSPGHLSFYDPEHKVFLTGDATLEINPAFLNSSLTTCIEMMDKFQRFAAEGFVETATDAHRSTIWSQMLIDETGQAPLSELQTVDKIEGADQCAAYYAFFGDYYRALKGEVLDALARLKSATVPQLIEEFKGSPNPCCRFKTLLEFPRLPSRLDVMVADVLREEQIPRRLEGNQIGFYAVSDR